MNNNNRPFPSSTSTSKFIRRKLALAIASQLLWAGPAIAGPTGGQVVGGAGSVEQSGRQTTVRQETDRLAVDWQTFDVGVDERVDFVQPGQSSVALNRILGSNGSQIQGQINANGHVILVNPNGIVFSKNATVNAGGLIASGLQINPDDFINGDLVFKGLEGTGGTVINAGILNASVGGNVALLGKSVENQGLISAKLGRVHLAAGEEAVLTFDQQGLLGVQIDKAVLQEELGDKAAVSNRGTITAEEGQILLNAGTAKDVFSQAVNWGDQKQARSVTYNDDGSFTLGGGGDVVNSGTLDASGEKAAGSVVALGENVTNSGSIRADVEVGQAGNVELHATTTVQITGTGVVSATASDSGAGGDIKLQGKNIGLFDQSSVDASGENGGGTVLVGGDREGLNEQVRNAEFVYVGGESSINVGAGVKGDGGKLVLFAEDTARIYGRLSARGGALLGDGGFVETSGKKGFDFSGALDVSSVSGVGGHWLIDPYDLTISSKRNTVTSDGGPFLSEEDNANLFVGILKRALDSGGTVTVKTGEGGAQTGGSVFFDSDLEVESATNATLNLIAHNNININANITAAKSPDRKLNINLHANTAGNTGEGEGRIAIADGVRIETSGGDFTVGAIENDVVNFDVAGALDVNFSGATIDVVGAYTNEQLSTYFPNSRGDRAGLAPSGRIAIHASQDVVLGAMQVKGRERENDPAKMDILAGRDITLAANLGYDNNPTEVLNAGHISNDGYSTLRLNAGRNIALNGNIEFLHPEEGRAEHQDRLHIHLSANAINDGVGNVVLGNNNGVGTVRIVTAGGDFVIDSAVDVRLGNDLINTSSMYGGGDIHVTASGDVTVGTVGSRYNFGGRTDDNLADNLRATNIDITADGDITLTQDFNFNGFGGGVDYSSSNPSPSLSFIAGNNLTLNGQIYDSAAVDDAFDYLNVVLVADADATANGEAGNEGLLSVARSLYTGGGNLDLSAAAINLNGQALNTDWANGNGGTSTGSTGGHIDIASSSNLALGNIRTDYDCAALVACGNLVVRSRDPSQAAVDVVNDNSRFQISGSVSFDVGAGDVVVNNVRSAPNFDAPRAYQNELIVLSANNVSVEMDNTAHLGDIQVTGDFHLDSEGDVFQVEGTTLSIGGAAEFLANAGVIDLTQANNRFGGPVSFAGANGTTAVSAQVNALDDLILGATTLSGELTASASGNITQTGVLTVGTATLSAGTESEPGRITLKANNLFNALAIEQAGNADIKNNRGLIIESAQVVESLTLEVDGNVIQGDESFHLNQLILQITNGTANLLNADNVIGHLSGSVRDGALVSNGPLNLGDFAVTGTAGFELTLSGEAAAFSQDVNSTFTSAGDIIINAPVVALGVQTPLAQGASQPLMDFAVGADLTFNNVLDFEFHGEIVANTENGDITVNGAEGISEFHIGDSATWQARGFILNGGADSDTLFAPNTDNQWIINSDNSGELDSAGGTLLFNAIEQLEGGAGIDQFSLSGPAAITLNGGAGQDSITGSNNLNDWQLVSDGNHELTSGGATAVFAGIESIIGNNAGDTLSGTNSATDWLINSDSDGTVTPSGQEAMTFQLINRFVGGTGSDAFELAGDAVNGVAGGEGDDTFLILTSQSGTLQGDAGSDRFIVGAPDISAHIDGGLGFSEDIDVLVGLSDANNLWTITADDQNALNSTITYTDIERLQGTEMDDTFTFEQGADITLQIAGGDGEGFDELNYSEIEGALDVQLGDNLNHVSGIENILGNKHADSVLTILDGDDPAINDDSYINNWRIKGENTGSVSLQRGEARNEVQFSQFAHLKGQAVIDHFDFEAAGIVSGSIDGGLIDPAGITGSRNSLAATDDNTTWTIDAVHQVSLTHTDTDTVFLGETNNISHLVGGDGDDRFIYSINNSGVGASGGGGEGTDTADFSGITANLEVTLGGASVNGVSGVELLIGNNSGLVMTDETPVDGESPVEGPYNSTLRVMSAGSNAWQVTDSNAGTVALAADLGTMSFEGFNQLVGGPGADSFELNADLIGGEALIDGGAGNDQFVVNTVFTTDLLGGEGDDIFQLAATGEIRGLLDGNGGNNTLMGFDGDLTWRISAASTLGQIGERTAEGEERSLVAGASNIQRLQGGVGDDWFFYQVNDSGVGASGGEGTDTADFSGIRADVEVTLGGLDVNGVSGVESLVGNNSGVAPAPEVPAEGEAPVADEVTYNSTLRVVSAGTNTWQLTDSNSGSVALGGDLGTMVFKDFNQLIGGAGGDEFVVGEAGAVDGIVGGAGHNRLDLRARTGQVTVNLDTGAVTAEQLAMTASGMDEVQTTLGPAASNVLTGVESNRWLIDGMGTGQVFLNHNNEQAVRFSGFSALVGGAGADDFQLQAQGSISLLSGAGGANSLQAPDTDNTWQIAGVDRGSLVDSHEQTVVFTQVGTLLGGKGADDFLLLNDTSAITGRIDGGAGVDHIRGAPIATDWAVDSLGLGSSRSINRFQRIETLAGAGGDDSFVLHSLASLTAIDGGAGHNTLDVSAVEQSLILGLQAGDAMADLQLVGMNDIVGSGDDTLRGADAAATWRIAGSGAGLLESTADIPLSVTFSGLQKVVGGANKDRFVFGARGALADGVDGGAGEDTLQSLYDGNQWRLTGNNRGDLSRGDGAMAFASIENLTGGWGDDTFDLRATLGQLAGEIKGEHGSATAEQNVGQDTVLGFHADSLWTIDQIGGGSIRGQVGEQMSSVRFGQG